MPRAPRLARLLVVAVACLLAVATFAQDGRELSPEARAQYAKDLKDAATLVRERQFDSALPKLDALIAQRPREAQARFLKGVVQTEQGQAATAIATFQALIEDYPELPEPYNNLAVLYAQKGDYDGARAALETALKTAPDWALAHENLGDIHARLAATHYDRAVKLDKDNKSAAAKLALARDLLAPRPAAAAPPPKP
jgi:tetratricopeptide (TPR) repeat protein